MLDSFTSMCEVSKFSIDTYLTTAHHNILNHVKDRKVFILVSGGVDSTVAFALLARSLSKERCYGLLVDHGLLRYEEAQLVVNAMKAIGFHNLHSENASQLFLERLKGVYDPGVFLFFITPNFQFHLLFFVSIMMTFILRFISTITN
jgi:GMP synthase (glutamine-hydrolysing)